MKKKKLKSRVVKIPVSLMKPDLPKTCPPGLLKAARKQAKTTVEHFKTKGHGWPLNWNFLIDDVVSDYFGFQVESVFLHELFRQGLFKKNPRNRFVLMNVGKHDGAFCLVKEKYGSRTRKA